MFMWSMTYYCSRDAPVIYTPRLVSKSRVHSQSIDNVCYYHESNDGSRDLPSTIPIERHVGTEPLRGPVGMWSTRNCRPRCVDVGWRSVCGQAGSARALFKRSGYVKQRKLAFVSMRRTNVNTRKKRSENSRRFVVYLTVQLPTLTSRLEVGSMLVYWDDPQIKAFDSSKLAGTPKLWRDKLWKIVKWVLWSNCAICVMGYGVSKRL